MRITVHIEPFLRRCAPWALALPLLAAASAAVSLAHDAAQSGPQEPAKRDVSQFNLGKGGLALQGFDPVAYFPEGGAKALSGSKEFEYVHEGVRYRFATTENLELFKKSPARFEPTYGGWCAWAMVDGEKVEIDPKSFLVTDGKLCVFYKGFLNDTRAKWLKDPEKYRPKADESWTKLLAKAKKPKGEWLESQFAHEFRQVPLQ